MKDINLLPPDNLPWRPSIARILVCMFIVGFCIIAYYAIKIPLATQESYRKNLIQLEKECGEYQLDESNYDELLLVYDTLEGNNIEHLFTMVQGLPESWIKILDGISDSQTEHIHLTSFQCDTGAIKLSGQSTTDVAVAVFIQKLLHTDFFKEIVIHKIVYHNTMSVVSFDLVCQLKEQIWERMRNEND